MTSHYVPGRGYTVRDAHGRIIGHSLTVQQRDALLAQRRGATADALLATLVS